MKLLVHACCGPCSIMPTRLLREAGHDVTLFYANSNIAPRAEYEKRLHELARYAADRGMRLVEGVYDPSAWERDVAPVGEVIKDLSPALSSWNAGGGGRGGALYEASQLDGAIAAAAGSEGNQAVGPDGGQAGVSASVGKPAPASVSELLDDENRRERCRACYRMRLNEAAAASREGGYDALSTTLAVSPYQFTDVIREELGRACANAGIAAHFEDYRPYYDEATRISRELGMYRQNYCGCRFSVTEGEATRAFIKKQRAAEKAERARLRAPEEEAARKRKAEKQAYADERARRRQILKRLRSQQ